MGAAAVPLMVGGALYSAYNEREAGRSESSYYNYLADTARTNAGLAEAGATAKKYQIAAQASDEERRITERVAGTVGSQKAAMVSGVGASSRSAQDIVSDTMNKGNLDEMALRYNSELASKNADIEAKTSIMNYGTEAAGYNIAGMNAISMSRARANQSLLSGAGSVASMWYANRNGIGKVGTTKVDAASGSGGGGDRIGAKPFSRSVLSRKY